MKRRQLLFLPLAMALFGARGVTAAEAPEISVYLNPS